MTREILFRGFHEDLNENEEIELDGKIIKGKWVEGYLVEYTFRDTVYIDGTSPKQSYIFPMKERSQLKCLVAKIEVIPETVSQYTGLDDKNEKKIFENDVVFYSDFTSVYKDDITGVIKYTQDCMFEIEYNDKYVRGGKTTRPLVCHEHSIFTHQKTEVIGTIFDKKEVSNE